VAPPNGASTASWRALGTGVTLVVANGDLGPARAAVDSLLHLVDRTYSRFRPDSELVRLNTRAGQRVPISRLLEEAIAAGLRGARLSDGLVNPTVGRAMRLIGYDDDFERIASRHDAAATGEGAVTLGTSTSSLRLEAVPGWRVIDLDEATPSVRFPVGVELDLGSTGKAFAADLAAAAALAAMGRGGALVSLGGDIAVAGTAPDGGWRVLVAEDSATPVDGEGEVITLHDGAVATSSITVRRWVRHGIQRHHVIDPRTGGPATGPWRTATVAAASCLDANIAATTAIILGEPAIAWLEERGLAAQLIGHDGSVQTTLGWPAPAEVQQ
jgi:thiamine biosynthesis lipoprotein